MKNKIIALFLLICVLVPCFAVFAFAEGASFDSEEYEASLKGEWKQASNGEYYNSRFDNFINVEQYINKSSDEVRGSFDIVGIEEYWAENIMNGYLVFYIYNPSNSMIPINEPYGVSPVSGAVAMDCGNDHIEKALITPELHEGDEDATNMFVRFYMPFSCGLYDFSSYFVYAENERRYNIVSFELGIISSYDMTDEPIYEVQTCHNYINSTFIFRGYNDKKTCDKQSRALVDEIAYRMNINPEELKDKHSGDDTSLVFLYEQNCGTLDYKLSLYTYNSSKHTYFYGTALFYLDGVYSQVPLYITKTDGEFAKFEVGLDDFNLFENIREYYIADIKLFYNAKVNGINTLKTDTIDLEARYVYSDMPSESFAPSSFVYDMTGYRIAAPSFAGNETGIFLQDEEYLVSFETKDIKDFEFDAIPSIYQITEKGDTWMRIKILAGSSDYIGFGSLFFYSSFPDLNYPDVSVSITRVVPEDITEEENANIVTGSTSIDVDVNFSPTKRSPVMLTADEEEYVEPNAIYLTAEVDGEIEINGNYTYYRLDSSVNGNGYYQTLSTLYFSIPNEYLQSSDIPFVDMYVKALEISYQSAMTKPVLYESVYNEDFRKCLEDIKNHNSGASATPFIYSAPYDEHLMGHNNLHKHSLKGVGCYDSVHWNVVGVGDYYYFCDEFYGHPSLIVYADNNSTDLKPMDEFLTTSQVTDVIKSSNDAFCEEFVNSQFVLNFNDEFDLLSYKDMSFWEMSNNFGLWTAIKLWLNGTTQDFSDSVYNIKGIETLTSVEMEMALLMSNEVFSNTYYVALSDVDSIKAQIETALSENESFVFARFDVFDYYSEYAQGMYIDETLGVSYGQPTDFNDEIILFQTRYYENLDVIRLETSNNFSTKLYKVVMDEIDTAGGGATTPKPIIPRPFGDAAKDDDSNLNKLLKALAIILVAALVVGLVIYFWPVVKVVIVAVSRFIRKCFVGFRNFLKRITHRQNK